MLLHSLPDGERNLQSIAEAPWGNTRNTDQRAREPDPYSGDSASFPEEMKGGLAKAASVFP